MGLPESEGKGIVTTWNGDDVDMVCHQAPSENAELVTLRLNMQKLKIERTILVGKEHILPVVTALGNVVWRSGKNESRSPRHVLQWEVTTPVLKENASVPFCPFARE
jgi:hypothetical protein